MPQIRVLVVAGDPLVRTGLASLLAGQAGCSVAGQIAPDADLEQAVQVYRPDVALWDMGQAGSAASEALATFGSMGVPIVALISDENDAADVYAAGARGLVARAAKAEQLAAALKAATEGLVVIDPTVAAALIPARPLVSPQTVEPLTARERDVLQLIAQGLPNKSIARQLGISEHTVKFHINAILGKLHATSRTEAVVLATRLGLVLL